MMSRTAAGRENRLDNRRYKQLIDCAAGRIQADAQALQFANDGFQPIFMVHGYQYGLNFFAGHVFAVYFVLVIGIPYYYSDKYE